MQPETSQIRQHSQSKPSQESFLKRFVILAAPRTGSNLLCTLLQSHPDVLCHHEIFNPDGIYTALPFRNSELLPDDLAKRNAAPLKFLDEVWQQTLNHQWVGFKMTHKQQPQVFEAVCRDPSIHKIVLHRHAKLKTYVSRLIAEQSGIWEDYRKEEPVSPPSPVTVDYSPLMDSIRFNEQFYTELEQTICGPRSDVVYEELFESEVQKQLLADLGLPYTNLTAQSRKQNPHPLPTLIANLDSLSEQLRQDPIATQLLSELESDETLKT